MLLMLSAGSTTSSLTMVPAPCASVMVAFVGPLKLTTNVSSGSTVVSPLTVTAIGCVLTPGANVSVPLIPTKSLPLAAVPLAVVYATVTVCVLVGVSVTVNVAVVVPLLPSVTLTLLMLSAGSTASSLTIVPTPWAPLMVAFVGLLKLTTKVSSGSTVVPPFTLTAIGCVLTPGANVSVPLIPTKSLP